MFLALVDEELSEPTESGPRRATCPCCDDEVIAKTGEFVTWHWAHRASADCDPWAEGETDWHLDWKRTARTEGARLEVPMHDPASGAKHRADIVMPDGTVIEVQHSRLPPAELREREDFYARRGGIRWIFDSPALGWMGDPRDRSEGAYERAPWQWLLDRYGGSLDRVWGQFLPIPKMLEAVRAPMAWDIRMGPLSGDYRARWASRPFVVKAWHEWIVRLDDAPDVLDPGRALRYAGTSLFVTDEPVPAPGCHISGCGSAALFVMQTLRSKDKGTEPVTYRYCSDHVMEYRAACRAGRPEYADIPALLPA